MKSILIIISLWLGCVILLGCHHQDTRAQNLVPAKGIVLFDEKPLPEASLVFTPTEENKYHIAGSAYSTGDGTFQLTTYQAADGIHPGTYSVTVFKEESVMPISPEKIKELEELGKSLPEPIVKNLIPIKYNSVETSDLLVEIPQTGHKTIRIKLQSVR
ncbi:MAG: hypothetical protein LBQ50_06975 [Planctomycetaceae bacterium]|jgi:hypothetical protein|nr:hypothetical protein [Planctomycetaceae bacterium]